MDTARALADLTEVSSQIEAAVIADADGEPLASTLPDEAARTLARAALELLGGAVQAEAATRDGCVFASRDGSRVVAAATASAPLAALVHHDLRTCLGALAEQAPKRRPRRKKAGDAAPS